MRRLLLYTLLALQTSIYSKSITINFEDYSLGQIDQNNIVIFTNNFFDDSFISFSKTKFNKHISPNYSILSINYLPCSAVEKEALKDWNWTENIKITVLNGIANNVKQSDLIVYPFFLKNGIKHKLTKITLDLNFNSIQNNLELRSNDELNSSVLSEGDWYKFQFDHSGIYEITYEELTDLNIINGPVENDDISIYSNWAKMLDFTVGNERPQDLIQLPSKLKGSSDGIFGPGASLLFYVEANGQNFYDSSDNLLKNEINLYSNYNYFFLRSNSDSRKKIETQETLTPSKTIYDFNKFYHHELELTNFIKSGRQWVGEKFEKGVLSFSNSYNAPLIEPKSLKFKFKVCSRYTFDDPNNKVSVSIAGDTLSSVQIEKVSSIYYRDYVKFANQTYTTDSFNIAEKDSLKVDLTFHISDKASGWLDFFILNTTERLKLDSSENIFIISKDDNSINSINILSDLSKPQVWDVTDIKKSFEINSNKNDSGLTFNSLIDTTRKFIVFNDNLTSSPRFISKIQNQNLHALKSSNYLIVTHEIFKEQAQRLIDLHSRRDNLSGQIVCVNDIYNEFSSGRAEATSIRDFINQIYKEGQGTKDSLKYVLLLGKGSYDPKDRIANNINYIPTFQSLNSVKLISSYVTDDFYGLMDDHEGTYNNSDLLDLGVGRIPAKNELEAQKVIDKIFEYYDEYSEISSVNDFEKKLLTSKGNWKNNILFVADDGDGNTHINQSNSLAELTDTTIKILNQKKIYVDAFPQESSSAGYFSPGTKEKLNKKLKEGALIVNYTGHGGELGWTSEQIYLINDIKSMVNRNKLPLFMTATCEFSRFDNPELVSAGEHLILKPQGGAIALFTTVRLVFSIPNFKLNETFYEILKASINDQNLTIGDIFKRTKVVSNGGVNDRNFTLLGDPAVKLALPLNKIILDSVSYAKIKTDTIKAISTPTIHGKVLNPMNNESLNFNGWVEILLFDKIKPLITLANDNGSVPYSYTAQEDLLFLGKAKVKNGYFKAKIFVPKDARQDFDLARLSFYAVDSMLGDATGYDESIFIGGTDTNIITDNIGPNIEIYLDDSSFVFGDNVTPSPIFIAKLTDSSGVNIIPNDVGKDINLTIDERSDLNYVLNDYYIPSTKSFQQGEVIYPIDELDQGRHSLEFRVFDNQNNSSKAYTEFIIENNPELALKHVLNYPNPFTTSTGFFFEHNQNSNTLDVIIHIYTVSGKIIKTLSGTYDTSSKRVGPIEWNGLDEFGDKIGRGVYIYQISVKNVTGDCEKAVQKLVLLR